MATAIKLPQLGENLSSGDVLDVKVSPGDEVTQGQILLEVEAEKSTVEVPSPLAGRITELAVKKGDAIHVGETVCLIEPAEAPASEKAPAKQTSAPAAKPGSAKDTPAGAEPSRPTKVEKPGPQGPSSAAPAPEGNGRGTAAVPAPQPAQPIPAPTPGRLVPAGPATRRLARELGVDLAQVSGSGPGGRVTPDDVKVFVRERSATATTEMSPVAAPALPDFERFGPIERKPLDGVRKKTAEQMSLSWRVVPHVTQHDQADITDLEAFRKSQETSGPKLTVTAFALKAAAIALRAFPQFNASLDAGRQELILKKYVHIGVAVDTERGLLVPVLRDVDRKSIALLAQELAAIADRAREKKLQPDEMRGGSFTITNLGGIGGTSFTPIINYPEVAILGLSRGRWQPVVREGQVVPRLVLPLSLSYDHRVIDGADAARFTRRVAELLEQPLLMLLHA